MFVKMRESRPAVEVGMLGALHAGRIYSVRDTLARKYLMLEIAERSSAAELKDQELHDARIEAEEVLQELRLAGMWRAADTQLRMIGRLSVVAVKP